MLTWVVSPLPLPILPLHWKVHTNRDTGSYEIGSPPNPIVPKAVFHLWHIIQVLHISPDRVPIQTSRMFRIWAFHWNFFGKVRVPALFLFAAKVSIKKIPSRKKAWISGHSNPRAAHVHPGRQLIMRQHFTHFQALAALHNYVPVSRGYGEASQAFRVRMKCETNFLELRAKFIECGKVLGVKIYLRVFLPAVSWPETYRTYRKTSKNRALFILGNLGELYLR